MSAWSGLGETKGRAASRFYPAIFAHQSRQCRQCTRTKDCRDFLGELSDNGSVTCSTVLQCTVCSTGGRRERPFAWGVKRYLRDETLFGKFRLNAHPSNICGFPYIPCFDLNALEKN